MPIDPNIPLAVRPVSPIGLNETPMESQAKAVALQGNVLEQQQKIRALRTQQAFGQAIAENGGDIEKALPQLYRLDPMTAMGIHRQLTADKQKAALGELEAAKSKREAQRMNQEHFDFVAQRFSSILDAPEDQQPGLYQKTREDWINRGLMGPQDMPEQFDPQALKTAAAGIQKLKKTASGGIHVIQGAANPDNPQEFGNLVVNSATGEPLHFYSGQAKPGNAEAAAMALQAKKNRGESLTPAEEADLKAFSDIKHPEKPTDQNKLEQQYRQVLSRELLSGSSPAGIEHKKVNTAIHLSNLFDSAYDPKTGKYNIPAAMEEELVMNIATLLSPNARVGPQVIALLDQPTLYSKLAGLATFVTGKPQTGNTQDVLKMFKDVVDRQGAMSEQIRDQEMGAIRALAPTDLEESRRTALESSQLPSFINRKKTGGGGGGKTVRMVAPDGGELNVPEADVDAAIKAGAKRK